jgi:hypothetical protein
MTKKTVKSPKKKKAKSKSKKRRYVAQPLAPGQSAAFHDAMNELHPGIKFDDNY